MTSRAGEVARSGAATLPTMHPSTKRRRACRRAGPLAAALGVLLLSACSRDEAAPIAPAAPSASTTPAAAAVGPLRARFETTQGPFVVELLAEGAPRTVASFCLLATRGFYDGQEWYGQSPVVRQIGRPRPEFTTGYELPREFVPGTWFDRGGRLAASLTTDSDASLAHGSGIFLTIKPQDRWNLVYPIFGTVVEGQTSVDMLRDGDRLLSVLIEGDPAPLWATMPEEVAAWRAALDRLGPVPPVARD